MEHKLKDELLYRGYNLRERANVYAGATLGIIAPIAALRYILPNNPEHSIPKEILLWGASLAINLGISFAPRTEGFPLFHTTAAGTIIGTISADSLQKSRNKKSFEKAVEMRRD